MAKMLRKIFQVFLLLISAYNSDCTVYRQYVYNDGIGKSYKLHTRPFDWYTAKTMCSLEGGTLAMPRNADESRALIQFFESETLSSLPGSLYDEIWLGFHDMFEEGQFVTVGGHPIQYYFHQWDGEKRGTEENNDCGAFGIPLRNLKECSCDTPKIFVCEKRNESIHTSDLPSDPNCTTTGYFYASEAKKCYKLNESKKRWSDAREICYAEGGSLALITSPVEEKLLSDIMNMTETIKPAMKDPRNYYYNNEEARRYEILDDANYADHAFLGFHHIYKKNHYITVNDEDLYSTGYVNWAQGEPDDRSDLEKCGAMRVDGTLADIPCSIATVFICEQPPSKN